MVFKRNNIVKGYASMWATGSFRRKAQTRQRGVLAAQLKFLTNRG